MVVALLFAHAGVATHLVARMQPLRIFQMVYVVMTLVVGAFLLASGVIKIWIGVAHREQSGWGWVVASGLLSVLLGILIYAQFPGSGLWVLGLFLAIELLFDGWGLVMLAFALQAITEI